MPRTNLSKKDHARLVRECGGVVVSIHEAVLGAVVPKQEIGNVGIALKIAAIRKHYEVVSS